MENQNEKTAKYGLFKYLIRSEYGEEILEPGYAPLTWCMRDDMQNKIIICPCNPQGVTLNDSANQIQVDKMQKQLIEMRMEFDLVEREELYPDTLKPTGKNQKAFQVHDISEIDAEKLCNDYGIDFFVLFEMSPDLQIFIVPCPIEHGSDTKMLFFNFDM